MNEEEFLERVLNKIAKEFGYDVASTLELMFIKKEKELDQYKNNWGELKKWINEYVETNTKWYNNDLSHHDKKYYEQIYSNTDFMLRKVLIQMKELEEDK